METVSDLLEKAWKVSELLERSFVRGHWRTLPDGSRAPVMPYKTGDDRELVEAAAAETVVEESAEKMHCPHCDEDFDGEYTEARGKMIRHMRETHKKMMTDLLEKVWSEQAREAARHARQVRDHSLNGMEAARASIRQSRLEATDPKAKAQRAWRKAYGVRAEAVAAARKRGQNPDKDLDVIAARNAEEAAWAHHEKLSSVTDKKEEEEKKKPLVQPQSGTGIGAKLMGLRYAYQRGKMIGARAGNPVAGMTKTLGGQEFQLVEVVE